MQDNRDLADILGVPEYFDIGELTEELNGYKPEKKHEDESDFDLGDVTEMLDDIGRGPKVGDTRRDGTVFAGKTADGKSEIYVMPQDLSRPILVDEAEAVAKRLNRSDDYNHGHRDWKVPDIDTLKVINHNLNYQFNVAAEGGYDSREPHVYMSAVDKADPSKVSAIDSRGMSYEFNKAQKVDKNKTPLYCRFVRVVPVGNY
jgi:hypothetical protein